MTPEPLFLIYPDSTNVGTRWNASHYLTVVINGMGVCINGLVAITLLRRRSRKSYHCVAFSLCVIYTLLCCLVGGMEFAITSFNLDMFHELVILFGLVVGTQFACNFHLILSIQQFLRFVQPFQVQVNTITLSTTGRSVVLTWLLSTIVYSPVVMMIFFINENALVDFLIVLLGLVYSITLLTAVVILVLFALVSITLLRREIKRGVDAQNGEAALAVVGTRIFDERNQDEEIRTVCYNSFLNLSYVFVFLPSLYTFITMKFTMPMKMIPAVWSICNALAFLWKDLL